MSAIRTLQAGLSLTTAWEPILSADEGRQIIQIQNNHATAEVLYVFGSNPKDADALRIAPGGVSTLYDTVIPSGPLHMRATVANDAVVMLNS